MRQWFLFFISCLAVSDLVFAQSSLTPELAQKISQSSPQEYIPVLLVLDRQVNSQDLITRVASLPKTVRRQQVIQELKDLAATTQGSLLADLEAFESADKTQHIRPLWIVNAIAAQVRVGEITELLNRHPEISRAVWDPPRPMDDPPVAPINAIDETGWGLLDIHAPQVWSMGYRGQGVVVGLIDTGMDYNHPDLRGRVWVNPGEDLNHNGVVDSSDFNGIDDDGNGYVDDLRGWDFYDQNPEVMDYAYQGTQAAGIILGDGSGANITGVAPQARVMILRCFATAGANFLEAQQYAILMNADVINSTFVFKWHWWPAPDYASYRQAADAVLAAGLVQSNAIGFDALSQSLDPLPFNIPAPASCPAPWIHPSQILVGGLSSVLASGAYDVNHQRCDSSSIGPSAWNLPDILALNPSYPWAGAWPDSFNDYPWLQGAHQGLIKPDLAAPTGVLTDHPGGLYSLAGGTLASAAHTTGVLALLLSAYPQADPAMLARIVMSTAVDMDPPGKDNLWGAGRLDALAAMSQLLSEIGAQLTGIVRDSNTGAPLDSVHVGLPDLQLWALTDSLGRYFIGGIHAGPHDVRFYKAGWDTLTVPGIVFSIGQMETLSVSLTGPMIQVSPQQIIQTLPQGDSLGVPVTVHNTGTSPLQATLLKQGNWVFGSLYYSIQAEIISGDAKLFGVEVADSSIWVTGGNNNSEPNYVYRFDYEGIILDTLTQPPSTDVWGWRDLAWDGHYLYGSCGPLIESLDLQGNPGPTISGPLGLHRALAWNPATDHFFACDNTSPIVEFGRDGVGIHSWTHALHIQGLAWHPSDEQGCPLYIFSQDGPGLLRVSKMNPSTGAIQFVLDMPGSPGEQAGGAAISGDIDVNRWCFLGLAQAPSGGHDRVQIHSLGVYAPWLIVQPTGTQVIPPGGTLEGVALLDASAASPGTHLLNLAVQHNAPLPQIVIPVSLTIEYSAVEPGKNPTAPAQWALAPARPNPFNSTTVISFELRAASQVRLTVWDTAGRQIKVLVDGWRQAGSHMARFDGTGLASGIYFVKMEATEGGLSPGEFRAVRKVVLLK